MPPVLVRILLCLSILASVLIGLVVLGYILPRDRKHLTRVLMLPSAHEADRAASAVGRYIHSGGEVSEPAFVSDLQHYFVVIEEPSEPGT